MPDFETHLTNDFGMQRIEEQWLVAWDMRKSPRQRVSENRTLRTA
jgi:hypothetical protein